MNLSLTILLALALLLLLLDAPTSADAQRGRRICRRSCTRFGGRIASCTYCRPILNCRRACSSRPRRFRRCVLRCRALNRQVRLRRRCYRRGGFVCRSNTAVAGSTASTGLGAGRAFLIPGQTRPATGFCSEKCYSDARFISAAQCNRRFCFVRRSCDAFPQFPLAGRCTATGANTPITLPDARVCFGNCLRENQFTGRFRCDGRVCELRPCGTSLAARTYSCVAKQPAAVAQPTPVSSNPTPDTVPVVCQGACQSGLNAQISYLTVQRTCPSNGCKIIRCIVGGATVPILGHSCVRLSARGEAITETPSSTEGNLISVSPSATPTPSSTPTPATASVQPAFTVSPGPIVSPTSSPSTATAVTVSPTPLPSSTFPPSPTPSRTPVTSSLSASEWDRCTVTRGGSISKQNNPAAPNGNAIDVTATIIGTAGATSGPCVVNLACRTNVTTVTCNTDGTIRVQITNAAQAAQLTLSQIYPRDCIFVYDRRRFGKPCILNSFTAAANENQVQVAERMLRRRMAENADVFIRIISVAGTTADAVITGTEVGPLSMLSALSITNVASSRILDTTREVRNFMSRAYDAIAAIRQVTVAVSTSDDFSAQIQRGSLNVNFDGEIATETNTIDAVSISLVGGNVNSQYTLTRDFRVDFTMNFNNVGDAQVRDTELLPTVSSNRTAFPNVDITPTGACCRLPALRFEEYIEVQPYLVAARGADGTISGSNWKYNADYPSGQWIVRSTGPVDSPVVTVTSGTGGAINLGRLPFNDVAGDDVRPATIGGLTINPGGTPVRADYQIDVDVGMIPALNFFFPTFVGSLQQKTLFFFDDRDGNNGGAYTPGVGFTPLDSGAIGGPSTNTLCGIDYVVRILASRREIDSQFVAIGTGGIQRTGLAATIPIASMNSDVSVLDAVGLENFCFVIPSPSPTPSVSATPSVSPSASASPSVSPSISVSPSVSVSASVTPTISVSPSASPTISVSPSASPTISVSPSASPSISVSPSASPTISASPSN